MEEQEQYLYLHVFYKYGYMQSASPTNKECICCFAIFNFHSQIALKLTVKAISQVPASNIFSLEGKQRLRDISSSNLNLILTTYLSK